MIPFVAINSIESTTVVVTPHDHRTSHRATSIINALPSTWLPKFRHGARALNKKSTVVVTATSSATSFKLSFPNFFESPTTTAEKTILECLNGVTGRGKGGMAPEQQAAFDSAIAILEKSGVVSPSNSPLLPGKWRLLYTSRPGTASPIQRTFTGVDSFTVYQEIDFGADLRVNNIVDFGPKIGYLKVEAEASTDARPLPGFTPRKGKGLPLFGVSDTRPPVRKNMRIDFQFDRAAFNFYNLPFTIPYPVPFRLLGDETKGWIDVTYLSKNGSFRLSRGNKGTLFVLLKDD